MSFPVSSQEKVEQVSDWVKCFNIIGNLEKGQLNLSKSSLPFSDNLQEIIAFDSKTEENELTLVISVPVTPPILFQGCP